MIIRCILMMMLLPLLATANPVNKVKFFSGNLSSAKKLAASEGKLYFAEFSASWCAPCRVLEETTFTDPQVISYISQNYIPVKVDIDAFDGIAMKQVYNVQTIPTIIVFNSQGKLLEKYDQSLATSKLLALLKKHNTPENRIRTGVSTAYSNPINTDQTISEKPRTSSQTVTRFLNSTSSSNSGNRPRKQHKPAQRPTQYQETNSVNNSSRINQTHSPMRASTYASKPDKKPVTPINHQESIPPTTQSPVAKPVAQGDGLYRFKVSHQPSNGFSVQIGAFSEYGNVLREVSRIQNKFEQPIIVHIVRQSNKTVYKILVGEFATRQLAINYQARMKQQSVEGVIKDLSMMK